MKFKKKSPSPAEFNINLTRIVMIIKVSMLIFKFCGFVIKMNKIIINKYLTFYLFILSTFLMNILLSSFHTSYVFSFLVFERNFKRKEKVTKEKLKKRKNI